MTVPTLIDGRLPLGRWTVDRTALDTFAGLPDSDHRAEILAEWDRLTEAVRSACGAVAACWLSGSYFTDKEQPGDLDCLYVIDHENIARAHRDPAAASFLQIVATSQVKRFFNLRIDSYVLAWWPIPGVDYGPADRGARYLQPRGYWDDFWSRDRDPDARTSALPRRGYLEVILDGYQ